MIINQEVLAQVTVTPEKLADLFCEMDEVEMAEFFNSVASEIKTWDSPFQFHMETVICGKTLSDDARKIMQIIGEYSMERRK